MQHRERYTIKLIIFILELVPKDRGPKAAPSSLQISNQLIPSLLTLSIFVGSVVITYIHNLFSHSDSRDFARLHFTLFQRFCPQTIASPFIDVAANDVFSISE